MIHKVLIILLSAIYILLDLSGIQCSARNEIVIGSILPLSGIYSMEGLEMKRGMELAVEEVNAVGGVMGNLMKIVFEDTASNLEAGTVAVRKLIYRNKVPLILGDFTISVNLAAGYITNSEKVVQIAIGPSIDKYNEIGPYFFSVVGFVEDLGNELAKFASQISRPQTAAFLTTSSSFGSIIQLSAEKYLKKRNISVVAKIPLNFKQTDFSPELSRLYETGPDIVFLTAFFDQADSILNQAKQIGFPQIKRGWYVPYIDRLTNFITQETSDGLAGVTIGVDEESYRDFITRYEQKFGEKPTRTLSAYAFDATKMAALGINVANSTDPDKLKRALFEVSKIYCGISGKKRFNQNGMQVSQIYSRLLFTQGKLAKFKPCPVPPWCNKIKY